MQITEEGAYRGTPYGWGIRDSTTSEAKAVQIVWLVSERWNAATKMWCEFGDGGVKIKSDTWVIGKHGERNDRSFQLMSDVLGWSGMFADLIEGGAFAPAGRKATLIVEGETGRDGKVYMRVKWINPPDDEPRLGATVTTLTKSAAWNLDAKYNNVSTPAPEPEAGMDTPPDDCPF